MPRGPQARRSLLPRTSPVDVTAVQMALTAHARAAQPVLRHFLLAIAAVAVALALTGCSSLQQEADTEAAGIADHVLPEALAQILVQNEVSTPVARGKAAQAWLSTPDPAVIQSQGGSTWVVLGRDGPSIRVDVYRYWESGSFLPPDQGNGTWGVACRTYNVAGK